MPDNLTDPSRSTAQFRAFVQGTGGEPERSWAMKASGRNVAILAGVVVAVALVIALISLAVA
jgi:tetrahydromethanopterin S-methyltransferase subunit G